MKQRGVWKAGFAAAVLFALAGCSTNLADTSGNAVVLSGVVASDGTLAGQTLDLTDAQVTKNGDPADVPIKPGMVVTASGVPSGATIRVQSADVHIELKGAIEALDLDRGQLVVLGTPVRVDALTRIEKEDGATLALADLAVGDFVEVSGVRRGDGSVLATYIEKKRTADSEVEVKGFACNLEEAAETFDLWSGSDCANPTFDTGIQVAYAGARVEGTPAEAALVEVKGSLEGSTLSATKVEFEDSYGNYPRHPAKVELYGPVTNLDETTRTFELLGYVVDYRNAYLEGPLSEGAYVEVEGTPDPEQRTRIRAKKVEVKYSSKGSGHVPSHEVKGQIEALNPEAMNLQVAGIHFYADEFTLIKQDGPDRPLAFTDLAPGDWVEVKYDAQSRKADGAYYAVKIEKKSVYDGYDHELAGYVQNLDRDRRTFSVGSVHVVVNEATRYEDGLTASAFWTLIQEGDRVEVEGAFSENTLVAYEIELKSPRSY